MVAKIAPQIAPMGIIYLKSFDFGVYTHVLGVNEPSLTKTSLSR